jgi:hypothetical protein
MLAKRSTGVESKNQEKGIERESRKEAAALEERNREPSWK